MNSEFAFTCDESIHLTDRRWSQLCAITFSLFSTGAEIQERPDHTLNGKILTLNFKTSHEFQSYVRRAFFTEGTRLVTFGVLEKSQKHVVCHAIVNLTPKIRVLGVPLESDDDLENSTVIYA